MTDTIASQRSFQTAEINAILSKINGLEQAQNNLTSYLESGKATDTILNKIQKNETELSSLKLHLEAKSKEISSVDDETYDRLVKKFVNYMGNVKSPEAVALRNAVINDITVGDNNITINFNQGVTADEVTIRDMIIAVSPELYNGFSRGDKCRIGRGISIMYNKNLIPELERGKKKGSTNTYHII